MGLVNPGTAGEMEEIMNSSTMERFKALGFDDNDLVIIDQIKKLTDEESDLYNQLVRLEYKAEQIYKDGAPYKIGNGWVYDHDRDVVVRVKKVLNPNAEWIEEENSTYEPWGREEGGPRGSAFSGYYKVPEGEEIYSYEEEVLEGDPEIEEIVRDLKVIIESPEVLVKNEEIQARRKACIEEAAKMLVANKSLHQKVRELSSFDIPSGYEELKTVEDAALWL